VVLPTGVGKTRLGITAIEPKSKVLIVSSRLPLVEMWKQQLPEDCDITVLVINTAYKQSGNYDLVIVDEVHRALSKTYRQLFFNITYKKLLCLTATIPKKDDYEEFLSKVAPIVYSKTLAEITKLDKVVANFEVINLCIGWDKKDEYKYNLFSNMLLDASIKLSALNKGRFHTIFDMARHYKNLKFPEEEVKYSKSFWVGMSMRRNVVQNNKAKIKVVHDLIEHLGPDRKYLVLCKSIDFACKMADLLKSRVYHSKLKGAEREDILRRFSTGEINMIVAVAALNEGIDIPDADTAIVVAADSTELESVQQLGRIIRFVEGKKSLFINLVTMPSVEERWTSKRTKDFKSKYVNKISEI
ncbi:MAG: DEAD/DEAH box helicase, partial [Waterburya sp.]